MHTTAILQQENVSTIRNIEFFTLSIHTKYMSITAILHVQPDNVSTTRNIEKQ